MIKWITEETKLGTVHFLLLTTKLMRNDERGKYMSKAEYIQALNLINMLTLHFN